MHSFAILALASSAFALPLVNSPPSVNAIARRGGSVVDVPVTALTSVEKAAKVDYTNVGPITANAANVNAPYSNILDNNLNNNQVLRRDGHVANVPVTAITGAEDVAKVEYTNVGPVTANAANVDASYSNILDNNLNNNQVAKRDFNAVNIPVDAITQAEDVVKVTDTNVGPVSANVANVNAPYSNILDNNLNNNQVLKRATLSVPAILMAVETDLSTIVHDVEFILGSNPTPAQLDSQFNQLSGLFASTTRQINALKGLNVDLLLGPNGVDVSLASVAATVNALLTTVAGLVQDVKATTGLDLSGVDTALSSDIQGLLNAVNQLLPPINSLLNNVLASVAKLLASLGITIQI